MRIFLDVQSHAEASLLLATSIERQSSKDLGTPSLQIRLSPQWNEKTCMGYEVSHSLGQISRFPERLYGPLELSPSGQPPHIPLSSSRSPFCNSTPPRSTARSTLPNVDPPDTFSATTSNGTGVSLSPLRTSHTSSEIMSKESRTSQDVSVKDSSTSPKATHRDSPILQELTIEELRSFGAIWDVFHVSTPTPLPLPVIAKIMVPSAFPQYLDPAICYGRSRTVFDRQTARRQVAREIEILELLSEVKPPIAPRMLGLFGGREEGLDGKEGKEVWVIIMEDVGVEARQTGLNKKDKLSIIELYTRLHTLGILHGDSTDRHWLRHDKLGSKGVIKLIDFDRAILRNEVSLDVWEKKSKREMAMVKFLLGMGPFYDDVPMPKSKKK
ncbi:hypothetical protein M231_05520 [Tremella mesenterica]|uniref:Protein kinase domain-containing protein n=1 Tax=Tremella mesenterica TaxID=5217 RepID=A0A4Q1BHY5_TREME|nr:hypothetical protein M231_05520 [Tremella mesenterica]